MEVSVNFFAVVFSFVMFSGVANAKRAEPKPVKSISFAGLKYTVPHWSKDNKKMMQNGGYVVLLNGRNSIPICTKQVYVTHYKENLEQDVQDNFITRLKIKSNHLIVESEKLAPIQIPLENFCDKNKRDPLKRGRDLFSIAA